jgi:hypothetical protein
MRSEEPSLDWLSTLNSKLSTFAKIEPPSSPRTPRGEWPRRGTEGTKSGATEAAELARVKAEGGRALFLSDFTSEDIKTTES